MGRNPNGPNTQPNFIMSKIVNYHSDQLKAKEYNLLSAFSKMNAEEIRKRIKRIGTEEKPEDPKFSIKYMDPSANPRTDFYKFCNGTWINSHPIPDDKPYYGVTTEIRERNRYILGKILEECAFLDHPEDAMKEQIGSFYLSAMDTQTIEQLRFEPIADFIDAIENIGDKKEIIPIISKLHGGGISVMFSSYSEADEKNSSTYAYYLEQGGLSLPNKDYYLLESFETVRRDYKKHIANMFVLYGMSEIESGAYSDDIFDTELNMAKASRTPVELRDPERNYNRFKFDGLEQNIPGIDVKQYLSEIRLPSAEHVVIRQPEFFTNLGKMLGDKSLESWKKYLTWKVLHFAAPYLHDAIENENFDFFGRKLFGQLKPERRWKRVVNIVDNELGEALGKLYVEQEFGSDSKRRMEEMVNDLREVFTEKLSRLSWMSEVTRQKALTKFSKFTAKIGYPSKFIDYSSIKILPHDFFGNLLRCNAFEFEREIKRVNLPVDKELWEMTPPTVNAYFSPTKNEIVFPAGILQPPYFDPKLDDAVNYGATGGVIAHEITHGFDDEGRKYDADGNLNEWWTTEDANEFSRRAKSVVDLYNSLEALPGLHVNGELTLGENIADIGGISIAYDALERKLSRDPTLRKTLDGFTPEQRFYISWSQSWRSNVRDETTKWLVFNNPHSPDSFRGEIPVRVHPQFHQHFKGSEVTEERENSVITIW